MKRAALVTALLFFAVPLVAQEQPQFGESIDVVRYVIPARVVDPAGGAITDLTTADFTASVGGKKAVVESVEWLGSADPPFAAPGTDAPPQPGRLIVVFMQTDFGRERLRVLGQLKFNTLARTMLEMFEPEDYVAVVSHDSHLKLQSDFTRDRGKTRKAIEDSIAIRRMELPPAPEEGPSLAGHLDLEEMRRASSPGLALGILARALRANDGHKTVIVGGWGIGERVNRRVLLDGDWAAAMGLFRNDRVPVVTLNTGAGGDLSWGLAATAKETGGFYARTQEFPQQSMNRLRGMLSGYYELVLRVDAALPPGEHRVALETQRANARVLVAPLTVIRSDEPGVNEMVELPDPTPPGPRARSAVRLYLDALQKLRDDDADGAEALLTQAIDLGGAPEESWYERALLRAARGEMRPAAEDLQVYLDRAPGGKHAAEARDLLQSWR
ncbi:MAG TPA: hypothetical protein VF432_12705 [Thermoanaerobaculia bacterium]